MDAVTAQEPALEPAHPPIVALVIVAEQVQQTVKRQHAKLVVLAMPHLPGLPPGDASRDDDVAEVPHRCGAGL